MDYIEEIGGALEKKKAGTGYLFKYSGTRFLRPSEVERIQKEMGHDARGYGLSGLVFKLETVDNKTTRVTQWQCGSCE